MSSSDQPPTRHRNWLWSFIGIALVAVILLTWLALFVQEQMKPASQLSLEQIHAAQRLWQAAGIMEYKMLYTVQRGGGQAKDQYYVDVQAGKVQSVILNGTERLAPDKLEYHSMPALLKDIELFLERDAQKGSPPTICRGYFDTNDGHLMRFQRQVIGTPEKVEINMEEFKPS